MDEYAEEMINELRKLANIYAKMAGDLAQDIDRIEEELTSTDPIESYAFWINGLYKYRKNVMEKVSNPKEIWSLEERTWNELIDFYTFDEEES